VTEEEWWACEDLVQMAGFLTGKACDTTRRWRLFTVACCDRLWSLIWEEPLENLVGVLDDYAEGRATLEDWQAALREHYTFEFHSAEAAEEGMGYGEDEAAGYALMLAEVLASRCPYAEKEEERRTPQAEQARQADLLRDVFNPFNASRINDASRSSTVQQIAQTIYDERVFDRIPILADALEEAGCTNAEILAHCRGGGDHVRGCWVLDLLLGKS
jgi:hypothetical protein